MFPVTHKQLIDIGARYLLNAIPWHIRCAFVVKEFRFIGSAEQPDIFGLQGSNTIVVEVKVSRSDFKKDSKKSHRSQTGLGNYRYYLCPAGMIKIDELPEMWGLMYCDNDRIEIVTQARYIPEPDIKAQQNLMYSIIRRIAKHKILNKHEKFTV